MPIIQLDRMQVAVTEAGDGPTVLFLHGNPDNRHMWDGIIKRLQSSYRCVAPDLPGFGDSIAPYKLDLSLPARAQYVDGVLSRLGVEGTIFVVVHDHGGPFGLTWAIENPHRVAGLVIINTIYHRDYQWHLIGRLWRTPVIGELTMALGRIPVLSRAVLTRGMRRSSRGLTSAYVRSVYERYRSHTRQMALHLYRQTDPEIFAGWDDRLLRLVRVLPTLVLWGENDPFIPITFAEQLGENGATVKIYSQYGHWLPVEAPELIAGKLTEFFSTTKG